MRTPLIVGIDPGTTSAYALLDTNGKLIELYSSKDVGLNVIIRRITQKGLPLVVGTDKGKVPDFVKQFSVKTGCKLVVPAQDVSVEDKKAMVKGHSFSNDHQMDSLASAKLAYHAVSKVITRVKKFLLEHDREKELVDFLSQIIREGKSLKRAEQALTKKQKEERKPIVPTEKKQDFSALERKYLFLKKEHAHLQSTHTKLKESNKQLRQKFEALTKRSSKKQKLNTKHIDTLFTFKEKRMKQLMKQLEEERKQTKEAHSSVDEHYAMMSKMHSHYILKRMMNFSRKEFEKVMLGTGDILLVDDPNVQNAEVINRLKGKVKAIVYKTKLSTKTKQQPFVFVPAKGLKIQLVGRFALIKKKELDVKLDKKQLFENILKEYKESRK